MEIASTADANDIIKKLKARGGRDQLLMFLTGPAGLEKKHCHESCTAIL
jgi:hypothetical protein